jgi:O-antigen/teichoic acid export membrane protein
MTLAQKTIDGVKWSSISQLMRIGTQAITSVILARLLLPEDFGLLGMALVFMGLMTIFNDMGIGSAIVQKQDLDQKTVSSIFWFNLLIGFLAMLITILMAPLVSHFYSQDSLNSILSVMSISFLFTSLSMVHNSLLLKKLEFKKLTLLELTSTMSAGFLGVSLAYFGYGIWSLVWQNISMTLIYTASIWITEHWKPELHFSWSDIKPIIGFSTNLSGFNFLNYFARNADYLLIGKFLGATALGYYTLAYTIMLFPLSNISSLLSKVMFPALSKIQYDNSKFGLFYLKSTKYIAFVSFPLMLGLFATADEFVLILFGTKWVPVVFLIKVLSIIGLMQSVGTTVSSIYLAKGRTDWMIRWGVFSSIVIVAAIFIGLHWGVNGVAVCYVIAILLLAYPNFIIPFRLIDIQFTDLILNLNKETATSLIMFVIVMTVVTFLRNYLFSSKIILISGIVIGILSYFVAVIVLNNSTYKELKNRIFSRGE